MFSFSGRSKYSCVLCSFRDGSASLVGRKRRHDTQSEAGNAKKRVTHDTFLKWKRNLDCECQTMTWLDCETGMESGKKIVEKLKCKVCTQFVHKIRGRKHFSDKWICGADSVCTSNVRDHFHNDQHSHAMSLLKKQRTEASGLGPASYAPITKAFNALSGDGHSPDILQKWPIKINYCWPLRPHNNQSLV